MEAFETLKSAFDTDKRQLLAYCTGGGAILVTSYLAYRCLKRESKQTPVKGPRDTVVLHQIGRAPFVPSLSQFAVKLETYLRMAKIPYENRLGSRFGTKKGKIPWIQYNDEEVEDSNFAIQYLNNKRAVDLNKVLKPDHKAIAKSFQIMVDEQAYWTIMYYRFRREKGAKMVIEATGMSSMVFWVFGRRVKHGLWGHGMGRHTAEEVKDILMSDLNALSAFIGNKSFLMGEVPCEEDCAVFGFLAQLVFNERDEELGSLVHDNFQNLEKYCIRMKEKYWPDWDDCLSKMK